MSTNTRQATAARRRWDRTPPDERRKATEPAVRKATERRKLGSALLNALESAGLTVVVASGQKGRQR